MAKNQDWWTEDPKERYWCEITARKDIGGDLHCPQTDEKGKSYWSYSLIKQIRPGDLIYHYSISLKAFVGISRADGTFLETTTDWTSHAGTEHTRVREFGTRPAWKVPLTGYMAAANPLTLQDVRKDQDWVRDWIAAKKEGGTVAAPFQLYPKELRANQGYLTKMPAEFVGHWPQLRELAQALDAAVLANESVERLGSQSGSIAETLRSVAEGLHSPAHGQGFQLSPLLRRAIEDYAVERAKTHFQREGYKIRVVGKPYDLECTREKDRLYVEVKGTTTAGLEVMLTPNEVAFAREHAKEIALFVVYEIRVNNSTEPVTLEGGQIALFNPWTIDSGELQPLAYFYALPDRILR